MLGFSFSCLTAWGASCFERWCADGVGARERKGNEGKGKEWLEMGGEKKPLGMLRGRLRTANGWGEKASADQRACLRGRLRTAWVQGGNGWGEEGAGDERAWLHGRLRTAWVQGSGWKWVGRRSRWGWASLAARTAADGGLRGRLRTAWVQGGSWKWVGRRRRWGWASLAARTSADRVGGREWLEMGGEKKLLGMSQLGCADGCGRRGWKGVAGNGWGEGGWKMVACRLAMCAYRLTDKIDAKGWG